MKLEFLTDFRNIFKHQISRKSVYWQPSCSMRTDRRTDMSKLTVFFTSLRKQLELRFQLTENTLPLVWHMKFWQRCCWSFKSSGRLWIVQW